MFTITLEDGTVLEYENDRLVKVNGARHQYMDGDRLIRLVQQLAQALEKSQQRNGRRNGRPANDREKTVAMTQTIRACLEQDGVTVGDTVIFALDTSGSFPAENWPRTVEDLCKALDALGVLRLILVTFDTEVRQQLVFERGEFDRLWETRLPGWGGTDPRCVVSYFAPYAPVRVHVLTDGHFPEPTSAATVDLRYLIWRTDYPQTAAHLKGARMIDIG